MQSRNILFSFLAILFIFSNSSAQLMHIHVGDEDNAISISTIDSVFFVPEVREIMFDPPEMDFGEVVIEHSRRLLLTITNTGNGLLVLENAEVAGEVFTTDFEDRVQIFPDQEYILRVTFAPPELGVFSENLVLQTNIEGDSIAVVPVFGSGVRHFIPEPTQTSMSIMVTSALIDGESLIDRDEIGVFTPGGVCAGGVIISPNFPDRPVAFPAYGADEGQNNGFTEGDEFQFRIWDSGTRTEIVADYERIAGEAIFTADGFIVVTLEGTIE